MATHSRCCHPQGTTAGYTAAQASTPAGYGAQQGTAGGYGGAAQQAAGASVYPKPAAPGVPAGAASLCNSPYPRVLQRS